MFDIGWSELLVIAVVALIAIGPKELPGVLRTVGQWTGKMRRMAAEFQSQFQEAMREAEMADLKKHADDLNAAAQSITKFDPLSYIENEAKSAIETPSPAVESSGAAAPAEPTAHAAESAAPPDIQTIPAPAPEPEPVAATPAAPESAPARAPQEGA